MESSSDSELELLRPLTPPDIVEAARSARESAKMVPIALIPEISKEKYTKAYEVFMDWRKKHNTNSLSENVLMAYFDEISKKFKPSTLWSHYSMLRTTLHINNDVNITTYSKLRAFLKRVSACFHPRKSKIFTSDQINKFIYEAPDSVYLLTKVVLIMGIMGACSRHELYKLKITNFKDLGSAVLVDIPSINTKTKTKKFTITGRFYEIFKKYVALRPPNFTDPHFFLNYQKEKCTVQKVGINKLGNMGKQIAVYLKLPNSESYTGHCFRRSAKIHVDSSEDVTSSKRHHGWKLIPVTEEPVVDLTQNKYGTSGGNTFKAHAATTVGEISSAPAPFKILNLVEPSTSKTWDSPSISNRSLNMPSANTLNRLTFSVQPSTSTTAPATTDPLIKLEEPSCSRIQEPGIDTTLEFLPEPSEQPVVNVAPKPKPTYKGRKDRIYCRLCLKTSNKNSLTPLSVVDFNYPGKSDAFKKKKAEKVEEIQKMIKFCLPFFDSLTFNPIICSICLARLRSSYDFANECLKNQRLVEKYADMYGATERIININEMVESKFALSEDESESDTDTDNTTQSIPKVTRSSARVSHQKTGEKYSHEDGPATKKQKIYNESQEENSLASSNEDTPCIKTEPHEEDDTILKEFLTQDMPTRDTDPDNIDNIADESMIKIEPEYIDSPDFIKAEPVDDLHVENEIFNKRTGIGTDIQEQHSHFPKTEKDVLDTGTIVPSTTREPVFFNVDSSLETTTSDVN